jgi:hypothetical protein
LRRSLASPPALDGRRRLTEVARAAAWPRSPWTEVARATPGGARASPAGVRPRRALADLRCADPWRRSTVPRRPCSDAPALLGGLPCRPAGARTRRPCSEVGRAASDGAHPGRSR